MNERTRKEILEFLDERVQSLEMTIKNVKEQDAYEGSREYFLTKLVARRSEVYEIMSYFLPKVKKERN